MVAIIAVYVLPPKESCKSLVNFDYRNGGFEFLSDRLPITFPKVVNDKLIFFNSSKCSCSIFYALFIFYDPAKSHRFIFILLYDLFEGNTYYTRS